ncbi:bifunctional trypsin-like peptidase domain-containing/SEL1-like repeat protein [Mameliella alba]|nr:bifunctional trypsin-like peptidase domain-containing/SEL1-like repeat protein [Mameliella alba]MBY6169322.1 bifunctional trypsin-like peptidase domain-containing/SEL1-like repeat protein [Mameliella alba]MBY6174341.1 bifunctional trypsin-like peptidase domain-containing/SEL1-like repeat protein [Mameliella alba]
MQRLLLLLALSLLSTASARMAGAQGVADCPFGFSVNAESSALQALVEKAAGKGGFWLSIAEAPPDVRRIARHVGRLQVCLTTPDGKPRTIARGGQTVTLNSPFVTNCTATLLPENRLLTNHHCYYDPDLVRAGFSIVQEARVNFEYTSRDLTELVRTYRVAPRELAVNQQVDALVLQVIGDANSDLGGHFPLRMTTSVAPLQELVMIHHPGAQPQQYSTGTCKVHRRQAEVDGRVSALRHTCETTGGSSGALLLDARTLSVVALHNQGGLRSSGDGFNGGHKIASVNKALDLGFTEAAATPGPGPEFAANRALADALLVADLADRLAALRAVETRFAGTEIGEKARTAAARTEAALRQSREAEETVRRQQALDALAAALELPERPDRIAALEAVEAQFPATGAARRAEQVLLRERAAAEREQADRKRAEAEAAAKADADRLADARQALTEALLITSPEARRSALQAVVTAFAATPAAERAAEALDQLETSLRDRARTDADAERLASARQALTEALLIPEPEAKRSALEAVIADFEATPAALRAGEALDHLATTLQERARAEAVRVEQAAMAALTEALLIPDRSARETALGSVTADFPDTEAARRAALALDQLAAAPLPKALDRAAVFQQARLRCALRAASPFDPDRPDTLPGIALERIEAEQAIAACSALDTQIDGSPATGFALARAYEAKGDFAEALGYYRLAHAAGYTAATTALGRFARDGLGMEADIEQAIGFLETSAESGDPVAMTFLATIYERDGGAVLRDFATARRYLDQAVALNHPHALFAKAEAYRNGSLYQKDLPKALNFYRQASAAGDMRATYEEAMIYWRGENGVIEADKQRALDLLMQAAEAGNLSAQHRIGNTYLYGLNAQVAGADIAPDFVKAKRWLAQAAENGFVQAQMQLGKIFAQGSYGVEKDPAEALHWYEMAAKQDFVRGLVEAARLYETGTGTEKDPRQAAAYWFRTMELRANVARQRPDPWDRDTARELQRLLRDAGVYRGGLDGAIGPGSIDAMKSLIGRYSRNITYFKPGVRIPVQHAGWLCQC